MRHRLRVFLISLCASACACAGAAIAQPPPAAETVAQLNAAGLELFEAGAYRKAIDHFTRARALSPHESIVTRNLALAHAALAKMLATDGPPADAVFHYQQAQALDPDSAAGYVGLTNLYYERGEYDKASRVLRAYLARFPEDTDAQVLAGEVAYQLGALEEAVDAWTVAVGLRPDDAALQKRWEKALRELEVEGQFRQDRDKYFTVRYEGDRLEDTGYHVLRLCGEARREMGRELRHFPRRPVEVILYTTAQFDDATNQRAHVAGLYDGKIRIRVPPETLDTAYLRRVVFHEYAHLVIGELTDNQCPYWLNEGLAQWLSEDFTDRHRDLLRGRQREAGLPSAATLERVDFGQMQAEELFLYNTTAFAFVVYLRDRYSSRYLLDMFDLLRDGQAPEQALRDSYRQGYAYFDAALVGYLADG